MLGDDAVVLKTVRSRDGSAQADGWYW
jgi:hypothetical protein